MKTPREVAHAVVVERYAVGPRCGGEMCCGWCDCATAAIKADRAARDASLRAEADEAWRALERIASGSYNVTMEWSAESSEREVATIRAIARAALALRSGVAPTTPDPKKGPTT